MLFRYITILTQCSCLNVLAYSNNLFTIIKPSNSTHEAVCRRYEQPIKNMNDSYRGTFIGVTLPAQSKHMKLITTNNTSIEDPFVSCFEHVNKFLFGEKQYMLRGGKYKQPQVADSLIQYPTGRALRKAELFNDKPAVHFPMVELIHRGYCRLNITRDYMQTAVDAFAIFIYGNIEDIKRLPADYLLDSARTISMMKLSREKLQATWTVVRGGDPEKVTYEALEKYRPLFQYLTGKEMARLNLKDPRIVSYIGTHPDLDRHQVGVVASKIIKMNRRWSEPKYLNIMNNLLCGVPMTFMRNLSENTYLQLSHQVFYHTRACDPLQIRFYLSMMTRTQALGKSYSWNAQDVSRLGLLLAEVDGQDLSYIKPEALAGLTARVAVAMQPANLQYFSQVQLKHIGEKPLNILVRKLKEYQNQNLSRGIKCIIRVECLNVAIIVSFLFK